MLQLEPQYLKDRILEALNAHPYRAPAWLRWNHAQTAWGPLWRNHPPLPFRRERVTTPDDDFIYLHRIDGELHRPTVLLLHGLEGSVRSSYVMGTSALLHAAGWEIVVMEYRSCSGELNNARRLYHSGETTDLAFIVNWLIGNRPGIRLYLMGTSLGGNVTLKWLGETPEDVPDAVQAAAALCPPFDLMRSGPHIDRAFGGLYVRRFLRSLIPKAVAKETQYPGCLDVERVKMARTFEAFDTYATAALHGFRDAHDYWARVACGQFLAGIRVPTMLIAAADDPFNPGDTLPHATANASPYLYPQFTEDGGHVGFVYGTLREPGYWAEEQVVRFFRMFDESERG